MRLAQLEEAPVAHRILQEAFAEYESLPYPSSASRESLETTRHALLQGAILLGELRAEAGEAAGWQACLSLRFRVHGEVLRFSRLAVLPAYRGRGFAHRALAWLEEFARSRGLKRLETTARSAYPDNRPFYTALGYAVTAYSEAYGILDLRTHLCKTLEEHA